MSQTLIVIHSLKDWAPYYPSENVITFSDYMNGSHVGVQPRTRIINLCRNFRLPVRGLLLLPAR